jgi:hypothetical protein
MSRPSAPTRNPQIHHHLDGHPAVRPVPAPTPQAHPLYGGHRPQDRSTDSAGFACPPSPRDGHGAHRRVLKAPLTSEKRRERQGAPQHASPTYHWSGRPLEERTAVPRDAGERDSVAVELQEAPRCLIKTPGRESPPSALSETAKARRGEGPTLGRMTVSVAGIVRPPIWPARAWRPVPGVLIHNALPRAVFGD